MLQPEGAEAARLIVPLKRSTGPTWMVEVPDVPATRHRYEGQAYILKSGFSTCTVNVTEWVSEPLVPVTTTAYFPEAVCAGTEMASEVESVWS